MSEKRVRKERSNRRDLSFNNRHREYGWDCPAVDMDFFIEFNNGLPCAVIEYKFIRAPTVNLGSKTLQAIEVLATRAQIPAFLVWYYKEPWRFWVMPMNHYAHSVVPSAVPILLDERKYVDLLYHLRGLECPFDVAANMHSIIQGDEYPPRLEGHLV